MSFAVIYTVITCISTISRPVDLQWQKQHLNCNSGTQKLCGLRTPATQSGGRGAITRSQFHYNLIRKLCNAYDMPKILSWLQLPQHKRLQNSTLAIGVAKSLFFVIPTTKLENLGLQTPAPKNLDFDSNSMPKIKL